MTDRPIELWRDLAACRGRDPEAFYDERQFPRLREVFCRRCPVRNECLLAALERREDGLWGGTSSRARAAILRGRPRLRCPSCRSMEIVAIADDSLPMQACSSCGLSWPSAVVGRLLSSVA